MLKQFLWGLFAVLMVIGSSLSASAQENLLYVEITTDPPVTIYNQAFFDQFKSSLSERGIKPVFIKQYDPNIYPKFWEHQAIHIHFDETSTDKRITFTPYIDMPIPTSPILEASFNLETSVSLQTDSLDTAVELAVGMSLYATYQCSEAISLLQHVLAEPTYKPSYGSDTQSINFYIANCHLMSENYDQSMETYQRILSVDDDELHLYIAPLTNLAWVYFQKGRKPEAFELIERGLSALDAESKNSYPFFALLQSARLLSHRAQLHSLEGEYDQAIADINDAIEVMETHSDMFVPSRIAQLYSLRGQTYLYLYEWDQVLTDYNHVLELDPDYADAYFLRGVLYYSILQTGTENYPLALTDFRRYLELAPEGEHAADAAKYVDQIQTQQDALNS